MECPQSKLVPVIVYIIAAINSCFIAVVRHCCIIFFEVSETKIHGSYVTENPRKHNLFYPKVTCQIAKLPDCYKRNTLASGASTAKALGFSVKGQGFKPQYYQAAAAGPLRGAP